MSAAPSGRTAPRRWAMLVVAGLVAASFGVIFRSGALIEAWLVAFVVLTGFAVGGLGLLMIGHLLGGYWLNPVRDELEAAALTMPLLAILAVPLLFGISQLYPWADTTLQLAMPEARKAWFDPAFVLIRSAVYLATWSVLAVWMARPGQHRSRSAAGLALLAPTAALAGIDWVMSRDPAWWSSLFGFAFAITQLLPALAGAVLVTVLRSNRPDERRLRSLERALMTLALLTLWLWFVQFLTMWMANLPDEVAWYIVRYERWGWVMLLVILPSLILGILLLLPPTVGGFLLRTAVILLIVQHLGHMIWMVNPQLEQGGALASELLVVAAIAAIWALWFGTGLASRSNLGAPNVERAG